MAVALSTPEPITEDEGADLFIVRRARALAERHLWRLHPSRLVRAAERALREGAGDAAAHFLHNWLRFKPKREHDGDRFLALDKALSSNWSTADDPLAYLRKVVRDLARRVRWDAERGARHWRRVSVVEDIEEDIERSFAPGARCWSGPKYLHAHDEVDPARRLSSREAVRERRSSGRQRPALSRLLAVADVLACGLPPHEKRLLGLLKDGIPPADAARLAGCGASAYINLLQKGTRLLKKRPSTRRNRGR